MAPQTYVFFDSNRADESESALLANFVHGK